MRSGVAGDPQVLALDQPRLVLAVEGGAAARPLEDRQHAGIVGHQQLAGRGAHEHLDPRRAGQALELGNVGDVVVGAADPEGEVAMHAARGALDLVGERLGRDRQRVGVGHFEHRGDPAEDRAARAGLEVLLVGQARLAKMHLAVDHAGQDVQPAAVDPLARRRRVEVADLGDLAVRDADVAQGCAVLVDDRRAGENEVEMAGHPGSFLARPPDRPN